MLKKLFNIKIAIKCQNPIIEDLKTKTMEELEEGSNKIIEVEEVKLIWTIEEKIIIKEVELEVGKCREMLILTKIKIIWMNKPEAKTKTNWQ